MDATQPGIVQALRDFGAVVTSLAEVGDGCPDLLCGYRGRSILFECKRDGKAPLTDEQIKWANAWKGGPLWVIYSAQQAIDILKAIDAN